MITPGAHSAGQLSTRRCRVLQVVTHLGLGGAERVALSLVQELGTSVDFAVFTVIARADGEVGQAMKAQLAAAHVPWFPGTNWPLKLGGLVMGARALRRTARAFQPDIIHYHTEIPEACGAILCAWDATFARIPAIRTVHNSIIWRYWPRLGRWCDRRLAHAHITCVSLAARMEFERYRGESDVPPPSVPPSIIYNGVSLPVLPPRSAPQQAGVRRVLFAGRFTHQKGTDLLAAALPKVVLEPGMHVELVLVGQGEHKSLLKALAARPPCGWHLTVKPPVAQLPAILAEFDLVVMPSRFEGLGLVAVEAALCGVPVVAANCPGLDEALPPDHPWRFKAGSVDELAIQWGNALRETEKYHPVATVAQAFAFTHFSPEIMSAAYRQLYAQVLKT